MEQHLEKCRQTAVTNLEMDRPFEIEEMIQCIEQTKRNKAAGTDNMTADWLKDLNATNCEKLLAMMNHWWVSKTWPGKMEEARIAALYKKGDPEKPENYRPLSLLNTLFKLLAAMMKRRIEAEVEHTMGGTQIGFRKGRSTTHTIYIARRMQEFAERAGLRAHFVFLDWEKAFDKINHDWLLKALESYGLSTGMIDMIQKMYANPTFYVEVEGLKSSWKRQRRGIRQGCPLSPYLFILVMNRIIQEVNDLKEEVTKARTGEEFQAIDMEGLTITELLFADDTMIMAKSSSSMESHVWIIEIISAMYGLKLNKGKCIEVTNKEGESRVHFEGGQEMKRSSSTNYLGTTINARADPAKEVNRRITMARAAEARMQSFWREGKVQTKWKILMYNAIVGAKLTYGLEVLPMNDTLLNKLDAFYYRGLRRIFNMQSTYINRNADNKNEVVLQRALHVLNTCMDSGTASPRQLQKLAAEEVMPSGKLKAKAVKLLGHIINSDERDLLKQVTIKDNEEEFNLPTKNRVGRPRVCWILETAKLAWERWSKEEINNAHPNAITTAREFDPNDKQMVKELISLGKTRA